MIYCDILETCLKKYPELSVFNGMASHRGSDRTLIFMYTMKIQGQKNLLFTIYEKKRK